MPSNHRETLLRQWWWSPVPFWEYLGPEGQGWANVIDTHPGCFNLVWASSGVQRPPQDYQQYAPRVVWALTEAPHIPMMGKTMADWAFYLTAPAFLQALKDDRIGLQRWRFYDADMNYAKLLIQAHKAADKAPSRA